ncbi:hypothetical protein Cni_G03278 [Canna indica]|uniref:UspA domain-containing protein n=1 Tax=Canna indica TaxID=4628 RepID=A0AAQ3JT84_9LILI|nr:hypothetical protein Cni_G03278 [Canna indica]
MENGGCEESFMRQLSVGGEHKIKRGCNFSPPNSKGGSKRWRRKSRRREEEEEEAMGWWGESGSGMVEVAKKRVIVVIDQSAKAKHAMMWALTHVANKGDLLTLLHVVSAPPHHHHHLREDGGVPILANSLGTLCKACKPEVEVEALVIQGSKLETVLSQVRKLEASVLVLSQACSGAAVRSLWSNALAEQIA